MEKLQNLVAHSLLVAVRSRSEDENFSGWMKLLTGKQTPTLRFEIPGTTFEYIGQLVFALPLAQF